LRRVGVPVVVAEKSTDMAGKGRPSKDLFAIAWRCHGM
jgi:hypothetical protein